MVRAMDSEHPPRPPAGASLTRLVDIMDRLLDPGGCPWDREQTLDTLRPFLVERAERAFIARSADLHPAALWSTLDHDRAPGSWWTPRRNSQVVSGRRVSSGVNSAASCVASATGVRPASCSASRT